MNANIPLQKGMIQRLLRFGIKWGTLLIVLFAILLFGSLWYLGHQGLPDFAKVRILQNLRTKGLELDFASMRWTPADGILV